MKRTMITRSTFLGMIICLLLGGGLTPIIHIGESENKNPHSSAFASNGVWYPDERYVCPIMNITSEKGFYGNSYTLTWEWQNDTTSYWNTSQVLYDIRFMGMPMGFTPTGRMFYSKGDNVATSPVIMASVHTLYGMPIGYNDTKPLSSIPTVAKFDLSILDLDNAPINQSIWFYCEIWYMDYWHEIRSSPEWSYNLTLIEITYLGPIDYEMVYNTLALIIGAVLLGIALIILINRRKSAISEFDRSSVEGKPSDDDLDRMCVELLPWQYLMTEDRFIQWFSRIYHAYCFMLKYPQFVKYARIDLFYTAVQSGCNVFGIPLSLPVPPILMKELARSQFESNYRPFTGLELNQLFPIRKEDYHCIDMTVLLTPPNNELLSLLNPQFVDVFIAGNQANVKQIPPAEIIQTIQTVFEEFALKIPSTPPISTFITTSPPFSQPQENRQSVAEYCMNSRIPSHITPVAQDIAKFISHFSLKTAENYNPVYVYLAARLLQDNNVADQIEQKSGENFRSQVSELIQICHHSGYFPTVPLYSVVTDANINGFMVNAYNEYDVHRHYLAPFYKKPIYFKGQIKKIIESKYKEGNIIHFLPYQIYLDLEANPAYLLKKSEEKYLRYGYNRKETHVMTFIAGEIKNSQIREYFNTLSPTTDLGKEITFRSIIETTLKEEGETYIVSRKEIQDLNCSLDKIRELYARSTKKSDTPKKTKKSNNSDQLSIPIDNRKSYTDSFNELDDAEYQQSPYLEEEFTADDTDFHMFEDEDEEDKDGYNSYGVKKDETPEEREARLAKKREKDRLSRLNETPEAREARLVKDRERDRRNYKNKTDQQRRAYLEQKKKLAQARRLQETPEEKTARLARTRDRVKKRLQNETPEQKANRILKQKQANQRFLENKTPEQREQYLQKNRDYMREYQRNKIANETPEEREIRAKKIREKSRLQRLNETPAQRVARRNYIRKWAHLHRKSSLYFETIEDKNQSVRAILLSLIDQVGFTDQDKILITRLSQDLMTRLEKKNCDYPFMPKSMARILIVLATHLAQLNIPLDLVFEKLVINYNTFKNQVYRIQNTPELAAIFPELNLVNLAKRKEYDEQLAIELKKNAILQAFYQDLAIIQALPDEIGKPIFSAAMKIESDHPINNLDIFRSLFTPPSPMIELGEDFINHLIENLDLHPSRIAAAVLYYLAESEHVPITIEDLAYLLNIEPEVFRNNWRILKSEFRAIEDQTNQEQEQV